MSLTREQLIAAGKKAMAANDIEAANEIADMLDAMGEQPATPAAPAAPVAPAAPGADARQEYLASFQLERKLPFGARLMRGPNGEQVLIAQSFTTDDPKEIKKLLAPLAAADKSRAEAAALRKTLLAENAQYKRYGLEREKGVISSTEVTAANAEARALRQEAAFGGLMRATVEQKLGEQSSLAKNPIAACTGQVLKGMVFAGQYVDEALGMIMQQPGMTQMGISATDIARGAQAATERDYPLASTGAQVAGGVSSFYAVPGLAAQSVPRGVGVGAQMVSGGTRNALIGTAEGAVSGYGAGTDQGSRIEKAGEYALLGGTLGGGLGAATAPTVAGVQAGGRALGVLEDVAPTPTAPPAGALPSAPPAGGQVPVPPAAAPAPEVGMEEVAGLLRKAATGGLGSDEAVERLASMAAVNPQVAEAAERLGFQLPPDIFIDHTQLQRAIGLTRSQQGSVAEASFFDAIRNAAQRADEIIRTLDGTPDLSVVSERVKNSLTGTRDSLKTAAKSLFEKVDKAVPRRTEADTAKLKGLLDQRVADLGGDPKRLSAAEQKLFSIINAKQPVTMALIQQEKSAIGQALRRQTTEYGSLDEATLKRLYGAMSEDQLATVGRAGGKDARDNFRLALQTEAKARALENRIVKSFGSEGEGSIASKLRTALTSGAKGDIGALNKVLQTVPDNLKKEAVASTLAAMSRSRSSEAFSFSTFQTLMDGLRNNKEVYDTLTKAMGPGSRQVLEDLYAVSTKIAGAQRAVSMTGKANQSMMQAMLAEGITAQALRAGGKAAVQGGSAAVGATFMGPFGAAIGASVAQALSKPGPERESLKAIAEVLRSEKFQILLARAARAEAPKPPLIREMVATPAFQKWSALTGIKDPEAWVAATLGTIKGAQAEKEKNDRLFYNPELGETQSEAYREETGYDRQTTTPSPGPLRVEVRPDAMTGRVE